MTSMRPPNKTTMLKVVILGNGGVGKSCLMNRFVANRFDENSFHTIGVEFLNKDIDVDGEKYTLQVNICVVVLFLNFVNSILMRIRSGTPLARNVLEHCVLRFIGDRTYVFYRTPWMTTLVFRVWCSGGKSF